MMIHGQGLQYDTLLYQRWNYQQKLHNILYKLGGFGGYIGTCLWLGGAGVGETNRRGTFGVREIGGVGGGGGGVEEVM